MLVLFRDQSLIILLSLRDNTMVKPQYCMAASLAKRVTESVIKYTTNTRQGIGSLTG